MNQKENKLPLNEKLQNNSQIIVDSLKEYNPIILLSSFSLLIATFSKDEFKPAQEYAIIASVCFLLAFFTFIFLKLDNNYLFSFLSLLFIIFGFVFLFLVVWKFAEAVNLLNKVIVFILIIPLLILIPKIYKNSVNELYGLKHPRITSYLFLKLVIIFNLTLSYFLIAYGITIRLYFGQLGYEDILYKYSISGFVILGYTSIIKEFFLKLFIKYEPIEIHVEKISLINKLFYYNSSIGIIFVTFSLLYELLYADYFMNDYFSNIGFVMLILINSVFIIIKKYK